MTGLVIVMITAKCPVGYHPFLVETESFLFATGKW
jgi:hypothetical protein